MRRWITISAGTLALVWLTYLMGQPRQTHLETITQSASKPERTPHQSEHRQLAPPPLEPELDEEEPAAATKAPQITPETERNKALEATTNHAALFQRAYDTEPRDAFWANDEEPSLKQLLAAVEFDPEELTEVTCKRTVCRVTFKEAIPEGRLVSLQARLLSHFGDMSLDNKNHETTLYVLRNDYTLQAP